MEEKKTPSHGKSHQFWLTPESQVRWLQNTALAFLKAAAKIKDVDFLFDAHLVLFDPEGFTIQHPIREYVAHTHEDCLFNRIKYEGFDGFRGWYMAAPDGSIVAKIDDEDMDKFNG
jgi:hypothetical protein